MDNYELRIVQKKMLSDFVRDEGHIVISWECACDIFELGDVPFPARFQLQKFADECGFVFHWNREYRLIRFSVEPKDKVFAYIESSIEL